MVGGLAGLYADEEIAQPEEKSTKVRLIASGLFALDAINKDIAVQADAGFALFDLILIKPSVITNLEEYHFNINLGFYKFTNGNFNASFYVTYDILDNAFFFNVPVEFSIDEKIKIFTMVKSVFYQVTSESSVYFGIKFDLLDKRLF